jgi:hypothetical protein
VQNNKEMHVEYMCIPLECVLALLLNIMKNFQLVSIAEQLLALKKDYAPCWKVVNVNTLCTL